MVLVKNLQFFSSFYCGLNRLGKCFCCYSRKEKGVFLTLKSQSYKSRNFGIFPKGLGLVHWSKVEIFSMFLFLAKSASKMYLTIITLETKKRSF